MSEYTVGKAYLEVIPQMSGTSGLSGQATLAGDGLGSAMSQGMSKSFSVGTVALGGIVSNLAMQGAAAIGSFFKDSISAGMDFDSAMAQVAATMGVTTDEVEDLSKFAQEMGATTAFSATESAEALNYMALAGYDAEKSMDMLPNVLNLAAAGSMDLARASDMVTDASSALGLSTEETTVMVDQMAQAASKSNTSVEQLGDAMLTVGGTAKVVKGGTQEISTALGILADNGIKGSEGGTALRNVILSLTAPTDKAATAMEDLGLNVFDAEGNMRPMNDILGDMGNLLGDMNEQERAEWISTVFNKRDLKSVEALLAGTGANVGNISESLAQSSVDWSKYSGQVLATGETLDGTAEDMASRVNAAFTAMSGEGKSYDEILSAVQERFGLTAEDAQVALSAVQEEAAKGTDRWSELSDAIGDADGAAQKMAETQLDNLAGDVTLFQSALEGVQIALFHTIEPALRGLVQFGSGVLSAITEFLNSEMVTGFFDSVNEKMALFAEGASLAWSAFIEGLAPVVEPLQELGAAIWELISAIAEPFMEALGAAGEGTGSLGEGLAGFLIPIIESITNVLREHVIPTVQTVAQFFVENILPILQELAGFIVENVVPAIGEFVGFIIEELVPAQMATFEWFSQNILPILADFAGFILEHVVPALFELVGWFMDNVVPALQEVFRWVCDNIIPIFANMAGFIMDTVVPAIQDMWKWFSENILPVLKDVADFIGQNVLPIFDKIAGFINDTVVPALSNLFGWIGDSIIPIFENLAGILDTVVGFLSDVANNVGGALEAAGNFFFGGGQPSYSYSYHAAGGYVSRPTVLDVAGERGGEFIWPSYGPYLDKYADAISSRMSTSGVTITGNEFVVRNDNDIELISRELIRQWDRQQRSGSWA